MPVLILHVCKADERTRRFSTTKPAYRIGRARSNDLVLDSARVAEHHCTLHATATGCVVELLGGEVLAKGTPLADGADVGAEAKLYVGEFLIDLEWRAGDIDPFEDELLDDAAGGDPGARLVYADWLETNGQLDHATFVRLQDRLLDDELSDEQRTAIEQELLAAARNTDARWRMKIARSPVVHCRMYPPCLRDWVTLSEIGFPNVRRCEECSRDIRYVHDLEAYVYFPDGQPTETHVMDILPTPARTKQRHEMIMRNPPFPRRIVDDGDD